MRIPTTATLMLRVRLASGERVYYPAAKHPNGSSSRTSLSSREGPSSRMRSSVRLQVASVVVGFGGGLVTSDMAAFLWFSLRSFSCATLASAAQKFSSLAFCEAIVRNAPCLWV